MPILEHTLGFLVHPCEEKCLAIHDALAPGPGRRRLRERLDGPRMRQNGGDLGAITRPLPPITSCRSSTFQGRAVRPGANAHPRFGRQRATHTGRSHRADRNRSHEPRGYIQAPPSGLNAPSPASGWSKTQVKVEFKHMGIIKKKPAG